MAATRKAIRWAPLAASSPQGDQRNPRHERRRPSAKGHHLSLSHSPLALAFPHLSPSRSYEPSKVPTTPWLHPERLAALCAQECHQPPKSGGSPPEIGGRLCTHRPHLHSSRHGWWRGRGAVDSPGHLSVLKNQTLSMKLKTAGEALPAQKSAYLTQESSVPPQGTLCKTKSLVS